MRKDLSTYENWSDHILKLNRIAMLLVLVAAAAVLLCGCGKTAEPEATAEPTPAATEAPAVTEAPAPTSDPTPTEVPEETPDVSLEKYRIGYEKHDPDETVVIVSGRNITWSQYYSWVYDIATQLEQSGEITDWTTSMGYLDADGMELSYNKYIHNISLSYISQIATILQKAEEAGVTLTAEQEENLKTTMESYESQFGGKEAFDSFLAESYITREYLVEQNRAMQLLNNLYEDMFGAEGADLPAEDVLSYLRENGYLYAKHILFRTVDDSQQALPEDEAASKKAEAEAVLAELQSCSAEELPGRFDSLMQQYSEDTGLLSYPDGYYFLSGEMVESFETAVLALEENGLSGLADDHSAVNLFTGADEEDSTLLGIEKSVGYGFAGFEGYKGALASVCDITLVGTVSVKDRIKDTVTLGVCHEIAAISDKATGRNGKDKSCISAGSMSHFL